MQRIARAPIYACRLDRVNEASVGGGVTGSNRARQRVSASGQAVSGIMEQGPEFRSL
jgi:hypothetical protein